MPKLVRSLRRSLRLAAALLLTAPVVLAAQPLPTPKDFVSNLDVRCYKLNSQPPLNISLKVDQLNPALGTDIATADLDVLLAEELCVPVDKNFVSPPSTALPFLKYVDWACYKISGGVSLDLPIHLDHLNPEIVSILGPSIDVVVKEPQQLCLPVRKGTQKIPADVLALIEWLDIECFRIETQQQVPSPGPWITLRHLNPLYAGMLPEPVQFRAVPGQQNPIQLCLPVMKNGRVPTDDRLQILQYSDVLCYEIDGQWLNADVNLTQLNPVVLAPGNAPVQGFGATDSTKLCVPVAKNGFLPPG